MPELNRGDWTLAYDVAGAAEAPVALLLHDSADDRRAWRALAMDMVEDFRTIAPDLRGFGESGWPPAPGAAPAIGDYADDLIALLDGEGVNTFAVIGAGFGAEVALELALGAPARVNLVVLSGALPAAEHPSYTEELRAYQRQVAERARLAGRFGMRRAGVDAATAVEGTYLRDSTRRRYGRVDADAFAAAHEACAGRGDLLARLGSLPVPALVVAGERDPLLPAARLLAETLPRGRLHTIEGCGRGAPFVAPRAFEGALGAFFGDVRAGDAHG